MSFNPIFMRKMNRTAPLELVPCAVVGVALQAVVAEAAEHRQRQPTQARLDLELSEGGRRDGLQQVGGLGPGLRPGRDERIEPLPRGRESTVGRDETLSHIGQFSGR